MMGTADSTSRSARDGVEDVIPDDSLVLLVGTATGSVDGEDADIISSKTLDGEGTTKRSNRQVRAFQPTPGLLSNDNNVWISLRR